MNVTPILVAHNCGRSIGEKVKGLLRAMHDGTDVVVADDASTDGSCEQLGSCCGAERVHVYHNLSRIGFERSAEAAAEEIAKSRDDTVLVWADAAHMWRPEQLTALAKRAESADSIVHETNRFYLGAVRMSLIKGMGGFPVSHHEELARDFEGRIVVVFPVRNEGVEIVRTIRDFRASAAGGTDLHFLVVDDHSEDGCCDILRGASDITLLSNSDPGGQIVTRNLPPLLFADQGVRGYVMCDAHERMLTQYGLERLVLAAERTRGIVGGVCRNLVLDKDFQGVGSTWEWLPEPKGKHSAGLHHTWSYARNEELQPVNVLNGACYAYTDDVFERLDRCLGVGRSCLYGWYEADISLHCKWRRVPTHVHTGVHYRHLFRGPRPYHQTGAHYWRGYTHALRVMFGERSWREIFEPVVAKHGTKGDSVIEYLRRARELEYLSDAYAEQKVISDEEMLGWLGIA